MTPSERAAAIVAQSLLPGTIANLQLWVRADAGITRADGATLTTWPDQSGHGRDLTGAGGTFHTNVSNGLPAVSFDGSTQSLASGSFTLAQPVRVLIAGHYTKAWTSGNETLFDGLTANTMRCYRDGATDVPIYAGSIGPFLSISFTSWAFLSVLFNGTSSALSLDGGTPSVRDAGTNTPGGFTLGARGGIAEWGPCQIGEVMIYSPDPSAADLTRLYSYLATRWYTP